MRIVYLSGSGRKNGNTAQLLKRMQSELGGEIIYLSELQIGHCTGCWTCRSKAECRQQDDMDDIVIPEVRFADIIVLGSPVFFNNVSSIMKTFMDRTWPLRNLLKNKVGAAVVVGRGYGEESALTAMNSFFLKHDMIVANRGVTGVGFKPGEIGEDTRGIKDTEKLIKRIKELNSMLYKK